MFNTDPKPNRNPSPSQKKNLNPETSANHNPFSGDNPTLTLALTNPDPSPGYNRFLTRTLTAIPTGKTLHTILYCYTKSIAVLRTKHTVYVPHTLAPYNLQKKKSKLN